MMNIPLGDFNRGSVGQTSFAWAGERIAPNICYEDLFGEEIAAHFLTPELAPTVLMNFSNIGWFGDSLAIDQHLQISRMRALEFERPMVRATNTGATVVIDHHGAVTHALPRLTRGVLLAQVQGRGGKGQGGVWRTPYAALVGQWGLIPLWCWAMMTVLAAYAAKRRGTPAEVSLV
jgi:apolipoprotein N-acyltransferase